MTVRIFAGVHTTAGCDARYHDGISGGEAFREHVECQCFRSKKTASHGTTGALLFHYDSDEDSS
jgi:hypothetical protein